MEGVYKDQVKAQKNIEGYLQVERGHLQKGSNYLGLSFPMRYQGARITTSSTVLGNPYNRVFERFSFLFCSEFVCTVYM